MTENDNPLNDLPVAIISNANVTTFDAIKGSQHPHTNTYLYTMHLLCANSQTPRVAYVVFRARVTQELSIAHVKSKHKG